MNIEQLVQGWFDKWEKGDYLNLPISENFKHTSPFGSIQGKQAYLDLVKENEEKFCNQTFEIQDSIYVKNKACVRYIAKQGEGFSLEVSEWYYVKDGLIKEIVSYYHIGEIREERQIENYT
ncbi:nuclear transport factor 2 family protein [Lishizhenia sp.]|uniref:nuclear transport factor 2 family protein n=1 Tax=Lishizhenia sp. TaxID=2497594 RepID=UPI00299DE265|nr:nuclear transport factor 2 family protein [Lishizhenia sp.]MDX1446664.1 nuclear transport factor 2 family protein [Lishizhenia sp.]